MAHWNRILLVATLLLLLCGCGGGDGRPKLVTVRGKVYMKGQPIEKATIRFLPVGGGQSSQGETNPAGEYELFFRQDEPGAQIGKHKVTISTFVPPDVDDLGAKSGGRAEVFPSQYNTNTTLENEVVAGENVIDFDLK